MKLSTRTLLKLKNKNKKLKPKIVRFPNFLETLRSIFELYRTKMKYPPPYYYKDQAWA